MKVAVVVGLACLIASLSVEDVFGWGKEGHEAIAQVASTRLSSRAQSGVKKYLGGKTLEQIAPFPDDYDHTPQGRWSGPLHYCNLPRTATQYESRYCPIPPGCVVAAIQNYTQRLIAEGTTGPVCNYQQGVEPCPLEFLVHFVGDIHQPLHVGYGDDEGGNTVKVTWFGSSTNLHHVWDVDIIQRWDSQTANLVSDLQTLISQEPNLVKQYVSITQPAKWANESFQYVLSTVYNFSQQSEPVMATRSTTLGQWYYTTNLPVVQQRLVAASVRLAALLNSIFQ